MHTHAQSPAIVKLLCSSSCCYEVLGIISKVGTFKFIERVCYKKRHIQLSNCNLQDTRHKTQLSKGGATSDYTGPA